MRFTRRLGEIALVCHCGADLAQQADALLATLEMLDRRGPALHAGTTVQFGWSRLTLADIGGELLICEPDFSGDAQAHYAPDVDRTLRVQAYQAGICKRAQAVGADVRFDQTIVVRKESFAAEIVHLDRAATEFDEFSGWFIGPTPGADLGGDPNDFEVRFVYELLELRPALLGVLQLPVGYHVTFDDSVISAIHDASGARVAAV